MTDLFRETYGSCADRKEKATIRLSEEDKGEEEKDDSRELKYDTLSATTSATTTVLCKLSNDIVHQILLVQDNALVHARPERRRCRLDDDSFKTIDTSYKEERWYNATTSSSSSTPIGHHHFLPPSIEKIQLASSKPLKNPRRRESVDCSAEMIAKYTANASVSSRASCPNDMPRPPRRRGTMEFDYGSSGANSKDSLPAHQHDHCEHHHCHKHCHNHRHSLHHQHPEISPPQVPRRKGTIDFTDPSEESATTNQDIDKPTNSSDTACTCKCQRLAMATTGETLDKCTESPHCPVRRSSDTYICDGSCKESEDQEAAGASPNNPLPLSSPPTQLQCHDEDLGLKGKPSLLQNCTCPQRRGSICITEEGAIMSVSEWGNNLCPNFDLSPEEGFGDDEEEEEEEEGESVASGIEPCDSPYSFPLQSQQLQDELQETNPDQQEVAPSTGGILVT